MGRSRIKKRNKQMQNKKTITVTPVTALQHLDNAVGKVQGTRQDFKILDMALQVLGAVVTEHARYKAEFGPLPSPDVSKPEGEQPAELVKPEPAKPEEDKKAKPEPPAEEVPKNGAAAASAAVAEDTGAAPDVQ